MSAKATQLPVSTGCRATLKAARSVTRSFHSKGVYPQSEGSLAIVGIDASEGFVDLWVHFFVAIVDIHQNGFRQKVLFFGFD